MGLKLPCLRRTRFGPLGADLRTRNGVELHMQLDESGDATEWMVEGGTPNALMRTGINRKSLPVGSEIGVRGYQSKDRSCRPACKANGRDMTFADGRKLFMGSSGTGAPRDGADPTER